MKILLDYIINNQLVIDKGSYLTIVIGQITVYAILLTFYQFIVLFQGTKDRYVQRYLGTKLKDYFVKKKTNDLQSNSFKTMVWIAIYFRDLV